MSAELQNVTMYQTEIDGGDLASQVNTPPDRYQQLLEFMDAVIANDGVVMPVMDGKLILGYTGVEPEKVSGADYDSSHLADFGDVALNHSSDSRIY
jgi:hypothetical protein